MMEGQIAVSIICNAYNHGKYIRDALEGFVMQKTNFPFEVLVNDDCSTDDTAAVAERAGATRVYIRNDKAHIGKGYALNFLLGQIARDFPKDKFDGFLVVDADNLLAENYVSEMNKTFSQSN